MPGTLDGKIAFVTGGASGIGQAAALRFAQEGAHVVLAHRSPPRVTAGQIKELGRDVLEVECDVTDESSCLAAVEAAVDRFGRIDVAVAAAGVATADGPSNVAARETEGPEAGFVVNLDVDSFKRVLDVNLVGTLLTCRALGRQMAKQGEGSIVTLASAAGHFPIAGSSPYCVSKAGVIMLTKVLARELVGAGVRVNAVAAGYTSTPMTEGLEENERAMSMVRSIIPMGRLGRPEEIAAACLFLASDDSSFMTGDVIHPAGGQFIG
jgi:NAD(P)-dependent dehydrogenase (short-subunit alcohol dehydrogenase family)